MSSRDLRELFDQYPAIIVQMPPVFTSHEFILALARQHQRLYIEALYAYRDAVDPFKTVHATLAMQLKQHPELVRYEKRVSSRNIFDRAGDCAQWKKLT